MTAIVVKESGEFTVDGEPKKIEELTQPFLEKLVDDSLAGEVSYEIEGDMPVAKFFQALSDGTGEGSELRKLKDESDKKAAEVKKQGEEGKELVDRVLSQNPA